MEDDLCFLDIASAAELLRGRKISPVELTRAYLERIDAINPQLLAYLTVTADHALAQARVAEQEIAHGAYRGPLHGIPLALKDNFDTAGIRTTAHSRLLEHNVPRHDAAAVRRLYAAGAILLGKAATHEFAHGGPSFDLPWPPARNPWNPMHFSGGSSSGSAAAVAAGLAAYALGTDTGGSVRSPAWLSGAVGLKPTFGLVSRVGVVPFSSSCDHVGPLTRSVEDCAIVLDQLIGHDPADPGSAQVKLPSMRDGLDAGIRGLRIGVVRHFFEEDLDMSPELIAAVRRSIDVLESLGAHVEEVRLRSLHDYYAVRLMLTESELYALHHKTLQERPHAYGHHFLSRCLPACLYTSADYITAQRHRAAIIDEMKPVYARYDALLTAGAGPAPSLANHKSLGSADKFLRPGMGTLFSVTGAPALALGAGFNAAGLPLGLQIAGRPFEDATVLRIGHAYEQATQWNKRRPQLVAGALAPPIDHDHAATAAPDIDPGVRDLAQTMAARAGLKLSDEHMNLLLETAPYALQLVSRLSRDLPWSQDQASAFRLQSTNL
jgi:aspartyl-tRNA(Asn)/glutamyl-tRNA(Gln) amidotransferase subunit A